VLFNFQVSFEKKILSLLKSFKTTFFQNFLGLG